MKKTHELGGGGHSQRKKSLTADRLKSLISSTLKVFNHSTIQLLNRKKAFTLAEVLITLGVIGVVAAITLPSFIGNYQAKVRTEQDRMIRYKLTQATDLMKSHGKIGPYASTKDFVNELKKYYKIAQICESDNLEQCWPTKTITNASGKEINVADLKTGKSLNSKNYSSDNIGIVTADGTSMILSYKDNCESLDAAKTYTWSTEDNKPVTNATTSCIAAVYDLNGKAKPNKSGVDVKLFNATKLGREAKFECKDVSGVCIMTTDMPYTWMSLSDCNKYKNDYGINECEYSADYWAGAMKACQDAGGRLPTVSETGKIANYVFNTNDCSSSMCSYQTVDAARNAELGNFVPDEGGRNPFWTNQELSSRGAYYIYFQHNRSMLTQGNTRDGYSNRARCVAE